MSMSSVPPAGTPEYFRVELDETGEKGVLCIGNTRCEVKKNGVTINDKEELERIVGIFADKLSTNAEIKKKQKWVVSGDNVQVHQQKFLSKKFTYNDRATKKILLESGSGYQKSENKAGHVFSRLFRSKSEPSKVHEGEVDRTRSSSSSSRRSSEPYIELVPADEPDFLAGGEFTVELAPGEPSRRKSTSDRQPLPEHPEHSDKRKSVGSDFIDTESWTSPSSSATLQKSPIELGHAKKAQREAYEVDQYLQGVMDEFSGSEIDSPGTGTSEDGDALLDELLEGLEVETEDTSRSAEELPAQETRSWTAARSQSAESIAHQGAQANEKEIQKLSKDYESKLRQAARVIPQPQELKDAISLAAQAISQADDKTKAKVLQSVTTILAKAIDKANLPRLLEEAKAQYQLALDHAGLVFQRDERFISGQDEKAKNKALGEVIKQAKESIGGLQDVVSAEIIEEYRKAAKTLMDEARKFA